MKFTDKPPCDIACMEGGGGVVHEFSGPVKLVIVDPPEDQYHHRKSGATFVSFANMMMGANLVIVWLFTLGFKLPVYNNAHIILCTVGLQFCMPSAILMLHSLNGASAPLMKTQRRKEHVIIHLIGLSCTIIGTYLSWYTGGPLIPNPKELKPSPHFGSGMAAVILAALCLLTGPVLLLIKPDTTKPGVFTTIHRTLGILTFLCATVCFILGIIKPSFQVWMYIIGYMSPAYMMLFFALFYTLVVLTAPISKYQMLIFPRFWKRCK